MSAPPAALLAARHQKAGVDATAGGSGDNTEVDGAWVDRQGFLSGKAIIAYTATLAQGATLSIAANLQDATSSGGAGAGDYGDALASTVVAADRISRRRGDRASFLGLTRLLSRPR